MNIRPTLIISLILCVFSFSTSAIGSQYERNDELPELNWLPPTTEMISVLRGPFLIPAPKEGQASDGNGTIESQFQRWYLTPLGYDSCPDELKTFFAGKTVMLSLEGSENFAFPNAVASNTYDGVHICKFQTPLREELIACLKKELWKQQDGIWSKDFSSGERVEHRTIAIPEPNIVVTTVTPKPEYLTTILRRIACHSTREALLQTLKEWHYLNTDCKIWAIRHYVKPTKDIVSPLSENQDRLLPDDRAIGLVFQYDAQSNFGQLFYLSANDKASDMLKDRLLPGLMQTNKPEYSFVSKVDKEATEIKVPLEGRFIPFIFALSGLLGHSINV